MTIFHVIKHYKPVGIMTMEEMDAMPRAVFNEWADFVYKNNSQFWYSSEIRDRALKELLLAYEGPEDPL